MQRCRSFSLKVSQRVVVTYIGVGVSVAVRVGQDQHVNVHGVQKRGQRSVGTIISGDLNKNTRH